MSTSQQQSAQQQHQQHQHQHHQRPKTPKCVEEKRRQLPIYEHYTLTPGKTKSHHPEAKCNHCLREFICGSKQRLIRHIKKCNNITNSDQIVADTLNTLAQNSSTGCLNQSILEASDLLPSRYQRMQHFAAEKTAHNSSATESSSSPSTTANNNNNNNNNTSSSSSNNNNTSSSDNTASTPTESTSKGNARAGSAANSNVAGGYVSFNGSTFIAAPPGKRNGSCKKTRKAHQIITPTKGLIHVTTGVDGKAHFTPASSLPNSLAGALNAPLIATLQNRQNLCIPTAGRYSVGANQGQLAVKLNVEAIEKAYVKLVLTRNLQLSLCDTKEFQQWLKLFTGDYKPPSSINLITQNLKQESNVAKHKISNILVKAPKKTINLELHNWSCRMRSHMWYAIVANLDQKRFLISLQDVLLKQNPLQQTDDSVTNDQSIKSNDTPGARLVELIDDCISKIGKDRINSLLFNENNDEIDTYAIKAREALIASHPSIIAYNCWWKFSNLICSDIIEHNSSFKNVLTNSNRLINFLNRRPQLNSSLPCFSPFVVVNGQMCPRNNDKFWCCHLVCYLLEFLKKNQSAITKALETESTNAQSTYFTPIGNSANENLITQATNYNINRVEAQKCDLQLEDMRTLVMSQEFWADLDLALIYLKPIQELIALTSTKVALVATSHGETTNTPSTSPPSVSLAAINSLTLSDFMFWFLSYGKTLFDDWTLSPNIYKQQLIECYLKRFGAVLPQLKLLFAAYLLNPRYKCAYVTSQAKIQAIEEILNIASEFMPEESDGHTIFDQWKLYLKREEPYDMLFDETRTSQLEWWTSLPCAESIRRVALRILRLKAMSSFKPEGLFNQLHCYEDENYVNLDVSAFEDLAILRYVYAYEDKSVQCIGTNGFTQIGSNHQQNSSTKFLPGGDLNLVTLQKQDHIVAANDSNNCLDDIGATISFGVEVDMDLQTMANNVQPNISASTRAVMIEELPGYDVFKQYVDYTDSGVQIIEEPAEKRRRKWTAQEILSKCQTNNNYTNNQPTKTTPRQQDDYNTLDDQQTHSVEN